MKLVETKKREKGLKNLFSKPTIFKSNYQSGVIKSSEYNIISGDLTLTFKSGRKYLYKNVTYYNYTMFDMDKSQGQSFNLFIKKNYPHIKLA